MNKTGETSHGASSVRPAIAADIPAVMELVAAAKEIMRSDGNFSQWGGSYPERSVIEGDIVNGHGRIVEYDGTAVGYFAFIPSPEPTYAAIEGEWTDTAAPYFVIHRIASAPRSHGVFAAIIEYAASQSANIRIDTHRDNHIMQRLILKAGFILCGVIHLTDGSPRLAYQRIIKVKERYSATVNKTKE